MEKKIKLNLIGITYNQIESGVYALILQQEGGTRRIPIIIGYPEAQAIECKLQDIKTPRPLTHDMATGILDGFNIKLREVLIRHLENGVFAADMILESEGKTVVLDSRSSDAIAMAIRTGAPIYTSEKVMEDAGFNPDDKKKKTSPVHISTQSPEAQARTTDVKTHAENIEDLSSDDLRRKLEQAVENEDYTEAARYKRELDRRSDSV